MRVKCLAQEHNAVPWPGLEPGPTDPESSALTIRMPCLNWVEGNWKNVLEDKTVVSVYLNDMSHLHTAHLHMLVLMVTHHWKGS